MYPLIRLAAVMLRARRRPPLDLDETATLSLRCWPWDLDIYAEMNNGRVLTLYDLGRFDHAQRIGLIPVLKPNGWGFAVGGASVRYRKRVRAFDRIEMKTTVLGRDERWFYTRQSMLVRGETVSSTLMRTCCTSRAGGVPTDAVAEALGAPDWRPALPDWVRAWIEAEGARPWPPEPG